MAMKKLFLGLLLFVMSAAAGATTYTVGSGKTYATIQACVTVAQAGDTCLVYSGTYSGATAARSGSAGNRITVLADTSGAQPIITSTFNFSTYSYITVSGFYFNGASFSASSGATYLEIKNNTISNSGGGITGVIANHVLVDGNVFTSALKADVINQWGDHWVIRNNTALNISDTNNVHLDFWQSWCASSPSPAANYSLLENNLEADVTGGNTHFFLYHTTTGGVCSTQRNFIIRFNKIRRIEGDFIFFQNEPPPFVQVAVYNNTAGEIYLGNPASWQRYPCRIDSAVGTKFCFNNIYYNSAYWTSTVIGYDNGGTPPAVSGSLVYFAGQTVTTGAPLSTCVTAGTCKINQDPLFTNYASNDFSLQAGSPAIGAGVALTTTVGTGTNSSSLTVAAAYPFQDGWAGVQPDWIRIGASTTVQISSINYDTNVITLATPVSWAAGDSVYLYKKSDGAVVLNGANPDIGAYQYASGSPAAATPSFSPVAGYAGPPTSASISCASGPVACYNTTGAPATDGASGCTTGTKYTAPVPINASETLYAVCGGTSFTDGPVGSAGYTINATPVAPAGALFAEIERMMP